MKEWDHETSTPIYVPDLGPYINMSRLQNDSELCWFIICSLMLLQRWWAKITRDCWNLKRQEEIQSRIWLNVVNCLTVTYQGKGDVLIRFNDILTTNCFFIQFVSISMHFWNILGYLLIKQLPATGLHQNVKGNANKKYCVVWNRVRDFGLVVHIYLSLLDT